MKMNYYGYHFVKHNSDDTSDRFLKDIRPLLRAFCSIENTQYKNQFTYSGENVYLLHIVGNLYLFLTTKEQDIIKKIQKRDLTVTEITELLAANEAIGFASYVYIDNSYLGFAFTIMAPRLKAFIYFVNSIFDTLNLNQFRFETVPLLRSTTRNEAVTMDFMGKSILEVSRGNSLFDGLRGFLGCSIDDFNNIGSIRIEIKPLTRMKSTDTVGRALLENIEENGLDHFLIKAKQDAHDKLTDLYLAGKGIVSDDLDNHDEHQLPIIIEEKIESNQFLTEKVNEHESDDAFTEVETAAIDRYHEPDSWTGPLDNI